MKIIRIKQLSQYQIQEYKIYVVNNEVILPTKSNLCIGMSLKYKTKLINRRKLPYEIYTSLNQKYWLRVYLYKDIFYDLYIMIFNYLKQKDTHLH